MKPYEINKELEGVAIIGMAGRFPGADNVTEFWENLKNGKCSIVKYSDEELINAGVDKQVLGNPNYVKAGSHIVGIDLFDAAFFGYTPREAECMDPQHRLFLECAWETFELAGYNPETYKGLIGVFGGCGTAGYLSKNLVFNPDLAETIGDFQIMLGNDNDYFTSRVSYKFNLSGPSINVQTACSTSLVAICMGYQNLITYQCDMALCGGASLKMPARHGYMYKEGFIFSPDGVCRAFDEKANGTVQGEGSGAVLLKRLDEAVRDGDHIHAVIRGAAVNNDGSLKAGFTAPSVDGQAQVIALAQELADISPDTITYVETHGTGTPLGDPIELAALTKAFRVKTARKSFCAIGSLKTNIGHLDAAAGVSGFIKTALAIENSILPPSLNYSTANSKLNIEESPFFVNTALTEWKSEGVPRRAGVSSFGIGGTNSHVILEEAPELAGSTTDDRWKVLLLSAKNEKSLAAMKQNLVKHLSASPGINLSDAAYTLQTGRKLFDKRFAVISRSTIEAVRSLETNDPRYIFSFNEKRLEQPVIFMFTGQGSQHPGMTAGLYSEEPDFKSEIDNCAEILIPYLGRDIRNILYPEKNQSISNDAEFARTEIVQPALFAIEYSLAKFWIKQGVQPAAFIGHSIGEYVAACLAGVFSLEDALRIVAYRGKLIQSLPSGSMLSVPLSSGELKGYLNSDLSIAAINGPNLCVASGTTDAIKLLEKTLHENNISSGMLNTSHAFHSPMMEPACLQFMEELKKIKFNTPSIRYISNVSGKWINPSDASDPSYWVRHLREPVDFLQGFETLISDGYRVFLEVGPENTLCSIISRIIISLKDSSSIHRISSLGHPLQMIPDSESIAKASAKLYIAGASINLETKYSGETRHRIPMPTYAFDRSRYWLEPRSELIKTGRNRIENRTAGEEHIEATILSVSQDTPLDEVERLMIEIWSEILGFKNLNISDNFFDQGGDSLKATQLIALINKRLGLELTLADLFIDPTIESLSKLVKMTSLQKKQLPGMNAGSFRFPILFPIQPKGTNPPMFIVAGAHGNRYFDPVNMKSSYEEDFLRYLSQLIPHIGMDQPVYGFRPKGLDASEQPHYSVEEMASAYIKKMRLFQPEGPYLIAGECVGGIVAYEMAQQLSASGLKVAHLILMDTHCPSSVFEYKERYLVIRRKAVSIIRTKIECLMKGGLRKFYGSLKTDIGLLPTMLFPVTKRLRSQRQIMLRSYKYQGTLLKYRPVPYKGETTLIVNEEWQKKEPVMGWGESFRTNMTIITVPGDHMTRLTTYGGVTGLHLRDVIKKSWNRFK